MPRDVRVLVVDDQAIVRDGLVTMLEHTAGIEVVGEAGGGRETVERALELEPDVVLMDLRMPDVDGVAATRTITESAAAKGSGVRVLVLTTYADDESIVGALQAGAAGYVTKSAGREQIVTAITAIAQGNRTFAPEVAELVLRGLGARSRLDRLAQERALTSQERRVLELIGEGRSNRAIAETLFVTVATVKTHVNNLFAKLRVRSRREAAALLDHER